MANTQHDRDISKKQEQEALQNKKEPLQTLAARAGKGAGQWLEQAASDPQHSTPAAILSLQGKYGNDEVKRAVAPGEKPAAPGKSAAATVDHNGDLNSQISNEIQRARGGGMPLDTGLQNQMGGHFGRSFDGVRVHTDQRADRLSQQIQARAFTIGNDIFFRQGAYEPHSGAGRRTLMHELTHVTQQSGGASSGGTLKLGDPNDRHEHEAERVASGRGSAANANAATAGVVQRDLASITNAISGMFSRARSRTAAPAKPSGVSEAQWEQLQKAGITDETAWNTYSGNEKTTLKFFAGMDTLVLRRLVQAKKDGVWPVDETDQPMYDTAKIDKIVNALYLSFDDWKNKISAAHRGQLLTLAVGSPSFIRSLAGIAKEGKWPKDENDNEITDRLLLHSIYVTLKTPFQDWEKTDKNHRKAILDLKSKSYAVQLVQVSVANKWPKNGSGTAITDKDTISLIPDKMGISFLQWDKIAPDTQRAFLLANTDKAYIAELAKIAAAGKWPQKQTGDMSTDGEMKQVKDDMKLSFAAWIGITDSDRRKCLLQTTSGFDPKHQIELAGAAAKGVWPKDGTDADIKNKDHWQLIKKVAGGISPAYWNGFTTQVRRDALAETVEKKRLEIINSANFERNSEGGILEKTGEFAEHGLVGAGLGAISTTSSILGASKGTGDNVGLDVASGVTGAVADAGNFLASGASLVGNIAKWHRGGKISGGENYSRAAKEVGKKEVSKGKWGVASSALGMLGSAFGFSGNVTKAAGVNDQGPGSSTTSGILGSLASFTGVIGSTLGLTKGSMSMHSARKRSSAAKGFIKQAPTGGTLTDDQRALNSVAQFTSKNQNKTGKAMGLFNNSFGFLSGAIGGALGIAGIFSKEAGFAGDIFGSISGGIGVLGGLAQTGIEAKNKPKDVDLDSNADKLIELLRKGAPDGEEAAKFTKNVLKINLVNPADATTWSNWIDEDENAAKELIKSKLAKF